VNDVNSIKSLKLQTLQESERNPFLHRWKIQRGGKKMGRIQENTSFICEHCGKKVLPVTNGSYRNHCPFCLYSKHLDIIPGDRQNSCKGLMKPIGLDYSGKKGFVLIHQCTICKAVRKNKVAINTVQEDNILTFIKQYQ